MDRQGSRCEWGAPSVPRALWGFSRGVRLGEVGQSARPIALPRRMGVGDGPNERTGRCRTGLAVSLRADLSTCGKRRLCWPSQPEWRASLGWSIGGDSRALHRVPHDRRRVGLEVTNFAVGLANEDVQRIHRIGGGVCRRPRNTPKRCLARCSLRASPIVRTLLGGIEVPFAIPAVSS
jgi:hypothetical protein